jgi:AraC family transcriptional regulator
MGTQAMRQETSGVRSTSGALDFRNVFTIEPSRASGGLEWVGLEAARYSKVAEFETTSPPITHHRLVLFLWPPEELELRYEGVKRHVPPPAGSISLVPAGSPHRVRSSGRLDSLHIYLEPGLVERVAAEAFDLDPGRLTVPPLDGLNLPHLRAAMGAVDAELMAGGAGGPLAAESLAHLLAVHLIRHVLAPRRPARGPDGALPRGRLRAVLAYIEGQLDAGPTLTEMAAVARLSPYHFARQFKAATGLPPHQYLIARRVERAKQLLEGGGNLPLAQVAARSGFADQSQFSHHFKRIVGVTPGRFRTPAGIDDQVASPTKKLEGLLLNIGL